MKNIIYDVDYMDMELGFAYRFLDNQSLLGEAHTHNYYEYFFITDGSITHTVNGRTAVLSPGDLLLIRSTDYHQYIISKDTKCKLINISFTGAHFEAVCRYLGEDVKSFFLSPDSPPTINISAFQESALVKEHEFLHFFSGDTRSLQIRLKLLLVLVLSLFIKYHAEYDAANSKAWLESLLKKMNTQHNIEKGVSALLDITGFSHGHLCRVMKTHMNTTPTRYITKLRMIYASNLLINSDADILSISMKVGYTSLSYFISTFKKEFGMPPSKYRQVHARLDAWK